MHVKCEDLIEGLNQPKIKFTRYILTTVSMERWGKMLWELDIEKRTVVKPNTTEAMGASALKEISKTQTSPHPSSDLVVCRWWLIIFGWNIPLNCGGHDFIKTTGKIPVKGDLYKAVDLVNLGDRWAALEGCTFRVYHHAFTMMPWLF